MILASSRQAERPRGQQNRDPSQPTRAPRREPGSGEIPMRLNAQPENAFPKEHLFLVPRGVVVQISAKTKRLIQQGGRLLTF